MACSVERQKRAGHGGWARAAGAEVHHVGADNQPGDVIITFRGEGLVAEPMSIVVEVRDRGSRAMGRKAISADMASKLAQRDANAGIYLSRTQDGLSIREIGEWGVLSSRIKCNTVQRCCDGKKKL